MSNKNNFILIIGIYVSIAILIKLARLRTQLMMPAPGSGGGGDGTGFAVGKFIEVGLLLNIILYKVLYILRRLLCGNQLFDIFCIYLSFSDLRAFCTYESIVY